MTFPLGGFVPRDNLPKFYGTTQRAGGVPLGAGTATFTDTNGMTVPLGSTCALVGIKGYNNSADANPTAPVLTVHGISGTIIGTQCSDSLSDNANIWVVFFLVKGLTPGATGNVVYSQSSVAANVGFIWAAMHFDYIDTLEDTAQATSTTILAKVIGPLDTTVPTLIASCMNHAAGTNLITPAPPMTNVVDLVMSTSAGNRLTLGYGYEYAPVTAKSYTDTTATADSRHGGIIGMFSKV
jgi:hypothetical protein